MKIRSILLVNLILSFQCAFFVLMTSCKNEIQESSYIPKSFKKFELKSLLKDEPDSISLNSLKAFLKYIPLQTSDSILIQKISNVLIDDTLIFVFEKEVKMLLFNTEGEFIRQIGNRGNGKGEYLKPIYSYVDTERDIVIIYDDIQKRILQYDYNSHLISEIELGDEYFHYYIPFYNDELLCYTMKPFTSLNEGYNIGFISPNGKIMTRLLKRNEKFDEKQIIAAAINKLYRFRDTISLWQFYYDTIYRILPNKTLLPQYTFDFGSSKMPLSNTIKEFQINSVKYPTIRDLIETSDYFFLRVLVEKNIIHFIIIKSTGKIIQIGNSLIRNNIDYSIDFWPQGAINDSTLYMTINPLEILGSKKHHSQKTELNEEIMFRLKSANILDNPWVIILQL